MQFSTQDGCFHLQTSQYGLDFTADRPFVILFDRQGSCLTEIFPFSSINQLGQGDDTTQTGPWQVEELPEEVCFSIKAQSSVWKQKIYRFRCSEHRLTYEIEVEGDGQLAEVDYFGGYFSAQQRWGSGFFYSGQSFRQGFTPEPNMEEASSFGPSENTTIDLMGVPLPGRGNWFFTPPPFFFGFESGEGWLGMGVEAEPGEHRFTEFKYHGRRGAFHLSLSYEGHTMVQGKYKLPAVGIDFGLDAYSVLELHTAAVRAGLGLNPSISQIRPLWWYEPIFCGWGAQCSLSARSKGQPQDFARQFLYERFLCTLEESGVRPGMVVLDDKWQATYGENNVDEIKWPDLRGFICKQHSQGVHVLLWLKAWDPEGLPLDECITNAAGIPLAADPTNPAYELRLRAAVRELISPNGYNADGFKIDFTARIPSGPGIRLYGDTWGLELLRKYLEIISSEARNIKSDALIITHTPHPYLADLVSMIRLNDMNMDKDINRAMTQRARVARLACPEAIIDTDNWPVTDRATWRSYLAIQPELGVPSLYYTNCFDSTQEPFEAEDYELIRQTWGKHRARK